MDRKPKPKPKPAEVVPLWPIWDMKWPAPIPRIIPLRKIKRELYTIDECPALEEAALKAEERERRKEMRQRERQNGVRPRSQSWTCCLPWRRVADDTPEPTEEIELRPTSSNGSPRPTGFWAKFKKDKKPEPVPDKLYVKICDGLSSPDLSETPKKKDESDEDTFEKYKRYPRPYNPKPKHEPSLEEFDKFVKTRDDIREVTNNDVTNSTECPHKEFPKPPQEEKPEEITTLRKQRSPQQLREEPRKENVLVQIHGGRPKATLAGIAALNTRQKKNSKTFTDIARAQPVCSSSLDSRDLQVASTSRSATPPSPAPDYIPQPPRRIRFVQYQEEYNSVYRILELRNAIREDDNHPDRKRRKKFKLLLALDSPDAALSRPEYKFPRVGPETKIDQELRFASFSTSQQDEMNSLHPNERKVIVEFCHLLEKSKQFFNGLRELPVYGHRCWHPYFGRTFDVYTKLWKYQQQHRAILDTKYGLKRWQIGEIASKIGQLYYHFYLRTSEIAYLNEACSFYFAIRGRSYYTQACQQDKCELVVKKLRYYTRFIVVCLLLKKIKLVKELTKDLELLIREYGQAYDPEDHLEWVIVLDEIKAFVQLEVIVSVIHPDNYTVILSHRLSEYNKPPVERSPIMNMFLQEIIVIGSTEHQAKFSELTLDMFRILQTLEREIPPESQRVFDESPRQRQRQVPTLNLPKLRGSTEDGTGRENPHKYLLYQPTPIQVLTYMASACNDLMPGGVLLLYISADGHYPQPSKYVGEAGATTESGVLTSSKSEIYRQTDKDHRNSQTKVKEPNCLYPIDIHPYTRKPLFLIIDSDNSQVFQNVGSKFGQPLVIFMSPIEMPSNYTSDRRRQGNMLTMFLSCPFTGFCYVTELESTSLVLWERASEQIDSYMCELSQIFIRSRVDTSYLHYLGDDFMRLLIYRYVFCEMTLKMHKTFRARNYLPKAVPPIPEEILEHALLRHIIYDLAKCLQVQSCFSDPSITSFD